MSKFLTAIGLGLGLATGAGLVYALVTNELALLLILSLGMFLLGGLVIGSALLLNNRQWINLMTHPGDRITNRYTLDMRSGQPQSHAHDVLPPPANFPAWEPADTNQSAIVDSEYVA